MEKQENNNLSELEQLKQQYETLKEQFDQQEIVNDRLMKSSIKSNVDFYMRYRWRQYIFYPLGVLVALPAIQWKFAGNFSMMLFWIAYLAVSFVFEIWMLRKLHVKTLENNDLLTLSNQARGFKKLYATFSILGAVPMFILFVGVFTHSSYDHLPSLGSLLTSFFVSLVIYVVCGVIGIRHMTRPCDEIIRQIEAAEPTVNRKTGFDRKQKWFCIAMFVAFLCLDVWAYLIVASHLKLPPMWHTVNCVRPADDHTTEGALEFWDVEADTLAISSEVLGGKPLVAYVTSTYPRNFSDTEPVSVFVFMTPEARQLWYRFTTRIAGHRTAIVMDGVVIQDWQVMCGIENGKFMITKEWSSIDEVKYFCNRMIKQ